MSNQRRTMCPFTQNQLIKATKTLKIMQEKWVIEGERVVVWIFSHKCSSMRLAEAYSLPPTWQSVLTAWKIMFFYCRHVRYEVHLHCSSMQTVVFYFIFQFYTLGSQVAKGCVKCNGGREQKFSLKNQNVFNLTNRLHGLKEKASFFFLHSQIIQ
jgi:hypothetical protein